MVKITLNKLGINQNNISKVDALEDINSHELIIGTNSAMLFEAGLSRNNVFQIKEFAKHKFENVTIISNQDLLKKFETWNFDVVKSNVNKKIFDVTQVFK